MHRKQGSDLIPTDTELERTLRILRKTKRAENAAMAEEGHDQTKEQRTGARRPPPPPPPLLTQWRIFGGLLFKRSILQSDNLLWKKTILN